METTKIMIYVTERETKADENGKKRKFKAYHSFSKNNRRVEVKFTEDCENKPTENCFIEVEYDKINLNTRDRYPVLWVKQVVALHKVESVTAEGNKKRINEFFGDSEGVENTVENADENKK